MKNAWALVRCIAALLLLTGLLFVMVQTGRDGKVGGVGVLGVLSGMAFVLFAAQCMVRRYAKIKAAQRAAAQSRKSGSKSVKEAVLEQK
ncbi:MAG: hypothetical protein MUD08_06880 [Cytophagales bacterium]|jgi:hypothetical protein|nr:hypothetical protein [Cytophagales bacterium]